MKFENEYWDHFKGETWKREINVRDFIQSNYTPYEGDDSFLVASSEKTRKVWNKLTEMFKVESGVMVPVAREPFGPVEIVGEDLDLRAEGAQTQHARCDGGE